MERYIRTYQQISATLAAEGHIIAYDQIIMFLQGLPNEVSVKIIRDLKVDIEDLSSFAGNKGFDAVLTVALAKNKERTNIDKLHEMQILSLELESKAVPSKDQQLATTQILKNMKRGSSGEPKKEEKTYNEKKKELKQQMESLVKEIEQLRLFNQILLVQQSAGGQRGQQQYRLNQQNRQYNNNRGNWNQLTETILVNDQGCQWSGMNGHRRVACFDYN